MKIAFLDRDGTIVKDYADKEWTNIKEPELLSGSISGLKYLKKLGYNFIIITNQYIIEEGHISYQDYKNFTFKLLAILEKEDIQIMDIFYCPHKRISNCDCCKPKTGMIKRAIKKYQNIDLKKSIFIGDSIADRELAKNMNINFYGINLECENNLKDIEDIKNYVLDWLI